MDCPDVERLEAFVGDELAGDDVTGLVGHLRACTSCRRSTSVLLRAWVGQSASAPTLVRSGPAAFDFEGAAIDRYHLIEPIGAGAMGVVFRARDPVLDRTVAVKVVEGQGLSSFQRECLLREARAMARVSHPNVIPVYDAGIADDDVYVTMALIEGANLRMWLAEHAPSLERRLDVCLGTARGLAAAHRAAIVHCDVKPDNVLVNCDDVALIGDFGLARRFARAERATTSPTPIGTREYMAPEVERGEPVTAASDQYSLAMTIHECLTGERPTRSPPPTPELPGELGAALARALSIDPHDRFPQLDPMIAALVAARRAHLRGDGSS